MTPEQLREFIDEFFRSDSEATRYLSVSSNTLRKYLRGEHPIPKVLQLACSAVASAHAPWTPNPADWRNRGWRKPVPATVDEVTAARREYLREKKRESRTRRRQMLE